ncbi:MAG: 30S ribosomal protein S24e [Nanobdellota archaeon]
MEINIISKQDNKNLSRTEVKATVAFEGSTPSRKDIQKELAKKLKSKEQLTILKTIHTSFGEPKAVVMANAYSDELLMKKSERNNLIEKHAGNEPKEPAKEEA